MGDHFKKRQATALKDFKKRGGQLINNENCKRISKIVNLKNYNTRYNFVVRTDDQESWNMICEYLNISDKDPTEITIVYKRSPKTCRRVENYEFFSWFERNKERCKGVEVYYEIKRKGGNNYTGPWTKLKLDFWK